MRVALGVVRDRKEEVYQWFIIEIEALFASISCGGCCYIVKYDPGLSTQLETFASNDFNDATVLIKYPMILYDE